jgi:tetratricopeptide (TPR) repeat protein
MRRWLALRLIAVVLASGPALADDGRDCFQHKDPEIRIKGCSEIIRRDPADVTAYNNRAAAYELSGDIDRAIADYTKVIELTPDNAAAYDNRGRAYTRKGDYTRSVADVLKANELVRKGATPKTEAIQSKQTRRLDQRQHHVTMWWCCRELLASLPAQWLRRLNCPAHGHAR